jgi:hypothetical protein
MMKAKEEQGQRRLCKRTYEAKPVVLLKKPYSRACLSKVDTNAHIRSTSEGSGKKIQNEL